MPDEHYMVNIDERLKEIKELVDSGKYFTIHKARQYGKTTTLLALEKYLQKEYDVVSLDFQMFGAGEFDNENTFALSFAGSFLQALKRNNASYTVEYTKTIDRLLQIVDEERSNFRLKRLFEYLSDICRVSARKIVLMI